MKYLLVILSILPLQVFAALPTINFETTTAFYEEGQRVKVTAVLSAPTTEGVFVKVTIDSNSTADFNDHNMGEWADLYISPGATKGSFTFDILEDSITEGNETLNLFLTAPLNASVGTKGTMAITIGTLAENNGLPFVNFSTTSTTSPEGTVVEVKATLSAAVDSLVHVPITVSGSAEFPSDHNLLEDAMTFFPGVTESTLSISIFEDFDESEVNEDIVIRMTAPVANAQLGTSIEHVITIQE